MFVDYNIVDLTLTIDEQLPCSWPTHMPFQRKTWKLYDPYYTAWLLMDEHVGTHFDAPSHFLRPTDTGVEKAGLCGALTGENVELGKLVGSAVVIDVTALTGIGERGESPYILPSHIKEWEQEYGAITKGEIVLFYTGWDKYYLPGPEGKKYFYNPVVKGKGPAWPAPGVEAMQYLYEKGVRCVGTDGASMGSNQDGAPVHLYGLAKGLVYVEALCNLNKLKPRGSYFVFLPLKIAASSGGPGRAIAFVHS